MRQREEERRALHDKLQANQEEIVQVQQEVLTSVDKQKDPFALRQYIAMVMEACREGSDRECPELGPGEVTNEIHEAATSRK